MSMKRSVRAAYSVLMESREKASPRRDSRSRSMWRWCWNWRLGLWRSDGGCSDSTWEEWDSRGISSWDRFWRWCYQRVPGLTCVTWLGCFLGECSGRTREGQTCRVQRRLRSERSGHRLCSCSVRRFCLENSKFISSVTETCQKLN